VDQFEELYALNPPEVQARFASFLGCLAEEAEVHVLVSLRDDFLFRCSEQDGLRPVFHDLTPLTAPSPEALRRALVEPAARRGVRFEEDRLVEEMVEAVASERGALPLLAFAVSRLWEERAGAGSSSRGRPTSGSRVWRGPWPSTRRRRSQGWDRSGRGWSGRSSGTW
jgi:hypothetical protein